MTLPRILLALALFLLGAAEPLPAKTRICIDPGHPSETSAGSEAQNGLKEVHVAWVVAVRLKSVLESKGYAVTMTKSQEGQLVRNQIRARIANRARAAVMVRLHCDSSIEKGFAVYYPDRQGKNAGVIGPSAQVMASSRRAAEGIRRGMARVLAGSLADGGVRGDSRTFIGGKQGALTGSIHSKVPVVTVEMVVLNQKSDAEFIASARGQKRMAEAIAAGIEEFIGAR